MKIELGEMQRADDTLFRDEADTIGLAFGGAASEPRSASEPGRTTRESFPFSRFACLQGSCGWGGPAEASRAPEFSSTGSP